jgi:hypothetical protein
MHAQAGLRSLDPINKDANGAFLHALHRTHTLLAFTVHFRRAAARVRWFTLDSPES